MENGRELRQATGNATEDRAQSNQFHIRLQYEDGSPAKDAEWKAAGSNGGKVSGRLDENGEATFTMEDEACTVTYAGLDPSIDARPTARRKHAFELVDDLVQAGRSLGLDTAVELLQYWRRGGDDQEGAGRPDECWLDMFGRGRKGKRLPHTVFSGNQLAAVIEKLGDHRSRYLQGTADRMRDSRISRNTPCADMKWEHKSGNWLGSTSMNLQFGFGHCTICTRAASAST